MSRLPAPPRLPTLPSDEEMQAFLRLFDRAAERDTQRRMKAVQISNSAATVRPGRR